jgi:hypothetical protein
VTDEGLELPVIDMTHPSFAVDPSAEEVDALTRGFIQDLERREKLPAIVSRLLLAIVLRRSVLVRGMRRTRTGFLAGMDTYLMKLGPNHLGSFAAPIDHKIAASLPILSMRLRLQDVARLLVSAINPWLSAPGDRPCHIFDIGGGPAIDAINALLLIHRDAPGLLASRPIRIHAMDIDDCGPRFGGRALAALMTREGPLAGVDITLVHQHYDWHDTGVLTGALIEAGRAGDVAAVSSEGALFEYGGDEAVRSNLVAIRQAGGPAVAVTGSVTRDDVVASRRLHPSPSNIKLVPRTISEFQALVKSAGWRIVTTVERPFSRQVLLRQI